jgi:hypothetical protein
MVFNANFNNISVISWRSVLFGEETRVSGENRTMGPNIRCTEIEKSYYIVHLNQKEWSYKRVTIVPGFVLLHMNRPVKCKFLRTWIPHVSLERQEMKLLFTSIA